ncbi:hypothetical protein pipiens_015555 [Culex pipiens pipiens]|uniref:Uncharacterized protein n=1 Tax=Culex pipiens pipiens TaxID=38569 RepID=A0ABD1CQ12_CULPP
MIRRLPKLCVATATLVVLLLLGAILDWPVAEAHVALTFPPARKYDLDFLDNSRTKAPCGMPKVNYFFKLCALSAVTPPSGSICITLLLLSRITGIGPSLTFNQHRE